MKLINQPIKVMAIFHEDGKIEPIKFRLDDQVIFVQNVINVHVEKALCPKYIFICQHNGNLYELKYVPETCTWYLFKK